MTDTPDLTALAKEIHAENVAAGWWDTPDKAGLIVTKMMLVITELSEAVEGDRKNLKDDHLPQHPMAHVELADAMIRLLDVAGSGNMIWPAKSMTNNTDLLDMMCDMSFPEMVYAAVGCVSGQSLPGSQRISMTVACVRLIAEICDFDIWQIVEEKREYNRNRLDHKRSERAKTHGKKY
jgi:hypothetical protein